ncbi:rod shape-determining protein RodA [soil metagenome]
MDLPLPTRGRLLAAEQSSVRHLDATLLGATIALCGYGLMMVYSATNQSLIALGQDPGTYLKRQILFLTIGLIGLAVTALMDYRLVKLYAGFAYALAVVLLALVQTPLGTSVKGAQRWFQVGSFQLSPSLFSRLAIVVMLAAFLSEIKGDLLLRHVVRATILAAIPTILVFIQPDIGTSIILAFVLVAMLVVAGAKAKHLAVLAVVASVGIFGAFQLNIIEDYQIERLRSFIDPTAGAEQSRYNRDQAEIAIGAGGVTGRGYLQGTQTSLDFVPEQHTDFIFTVVGEELGFIGAIGLLALYALVLWRALRIAQMALDPFGTFVATGIAAFLAIQLCINVGMTIGIMPITGIPLPFVSYGGSALIADLLGIGLLQSIHRRRFV